jgi:Gluconate 2-dehydrogenase subunit 3
MLKKSHMPVSRRSVLKQMAITSAGLLLIPSCMQDRSKASILVKNFSITTDQEAMLAELTESIIPKTTTPGAKDIYAHLFVLKMMDDCSSKEEQEKFLKGLHAFEIFAKEKNGKSFLASNAKEREMVLEALGKNKDQKDDMGLFYSSVKHLTIQAYTTSEFYLTKVQVYELVPARWHGCVPVKKSA